MKKSRGAPYRYTECGLDDVLIHELKPITDDDGEMTYEIPFVNLLHKAIAASIVERESAMTGKHLRFLRTEMGMTQAELAKAVHKEHITIGRWERGENPIDENAETLIRLITIERLELAQRISVEKLSEYSLQSADSGPINIDGSNPKKYQPMAA